MRFWAETIASIIKGKPQYFVNLFLSTNSSKYTSPYPVRLCNEFEHRSVSHPNKTRIDYSMFE